MDFFVLVINPILGFTELTKIYLSLAISLKLSLITIITACDLVKPETLDIFITDYKNLLKLFNLKKISLVVTSNKDIELFSRNIEEPIHPIFIISCKTGFGLDYLIDFFSLLTPKKKSIFNLYKSIGLDTTINNKECKFDIHEHFVSLEKKIIVAGFVSKGKIKVGEKYHLGPDKLGKFQIVEIEGLHCRKVPSMEALEGYFVTVSIKSNFNFIFKKRI